MSSLPDAGVEAHEGVGEVVVFEVVLRGEVVGFGLAFLAYSRGEFVVLVKVVRDGARGCRRTCRVGSSLRIAA